MSAHHEVEVTIDSHPRRLCYTMAAFRRAKALGFDLLHASEQDNASLADVANIAPILWAGLTAEGRADYPTPADLEEVLTPADLPALMTALVEAVTKASVAELPAGDGPLVP